MDYIFISPVALLSIGYVIIDLAHSKGQGQDFANFDGEHLVNINRQGKRYNYYQIECPILAFDWHIYI